MYACMTTQRKSPYNAVLLIDTSPKSSRRQTQNATGTPIYRLRELFLDVSKFVSSFVSNLML